MTATVEPAETSEAQGRAAAGPAAGGGQLGTAEDELARKLAEEARAEGLRLAGPGGLLGRVTKRVLEAALEGEMDAHLGYAKHDPAGRDGGTPATGTGPRPCSPISARWRSGCPATGTPASPRRSWPSGSGG